MDKNQDNVEQCFNESELQEILSSLEIEQDATLSPEDMEKIAKAWSLVERKKLFKQ